MVCNLTIGRPRYAPFEEKLQNTLAEAQDLRQQLINLAEADQYAIEQLMAAYQLPQQNMQEQKKRQIAVQSALQRAIQVPLEVIVACTHLVHLVGQIIDKINPNALGDAAAAVRLAEAGLQISQMNMAINLKLLDNPRQNQIFQTELNTVLKGKDQTKTHIVTYVLQHSDCVYGIVNTLYSSSE